MQLILVIRIVSLIRKKLVSAAKAVIRHNVNYTGITHNSNSLCFIIWTRIPVTDIIDVYKRQHLYLASLVIYMYAFCTFLYAFINLKF